MLRRCGKLSFPHCETTHCSCKEGHYLYSMKITTIILLAGAIIYGASAQKTNATHTSKAVRTFQSLYSNISSVSLSYSNGSTQGTLQAKRNQGYVITLPGRRYVSNGTLVWHVQSQTRTVVINAIDKHDAGASLDRVFFVLMNVYTPSERSSAPGSMAVRLTPPHPTTMVAGVTQLDVIMNKKGVITSIVVTEGDITTTWKVRSLKRNPSLSPTLFTYTPPPGWTVVDLTK